MDLAEAVAIARRVYLVFGRLSRDGYGVHCVRPTRYRENGAGGLWGVQIFYRPGFGGFAIDRIGAQFVAADLERIWEQYRK